MSKLERLIGAGKTAKEQGLKPYKEGKFNFENPTEKMEKLAQQRLEICKGCEFFKDEVVDFLKVEDKHTPEASGKYCGDCFCIISYKIRQTKELCAKWQEKK